MTSFSPVQKRVKLIQPIGKRGIIGVLRTSAENINYRYCSKMGIQEIFMDVRFRAVISTGDRIFCKVPIFLALGITRSHIKSGLIGFGCTGG